MLVGFVLLLVAACSSADDDVGGAGSGSGGRSAGGAPGTGGGGTLGGVGGAAAGTLFLGRRCVSSIDCGDRLDCVTVDSGMLDGAGPPGGYCTLPCGDSAEVCGQISDEASCRALGDGDGAAYCVLACVPGSDDAKCHGRRDTACESSEDNPSGGVCVPRCNSDTDCCPVGVVCGPARYCDPGSGLCTAERPVGLPIGADCSGPDDDRCRGLCRNVAGAEPERYACSERCTFGASPACGFSPDHGPAAAYCFLADLAVVGAARAAGDGGYCALTCDCDGQCGAGQVCRPFEVAMDALATGRAGTCTGAAEGDSSLPCAPGGGGGAAGAAGSSSAGTEGGGIAGAGGRGDANAGDAGRGGDSGRGGEPSSNAGATADGAGAGGAAGGDPRDAEAAAGGIEQRDPP